LAHQAAVLADDLVARVAERGDRVGAAIASGEAFRVAGTEFLAGAALVRRHAHAAAAILLLRAAVVQGVDAGPVITSILVRATSAGGRTLAVAATAPAALLAISQIARRP
jgi:hypothetical protein